MSEYRILALDGGGIRGLVTATFLKRLSEHPELDGVFDNVDLIAGNSSGALIALAMAHGLAPQPRPMKLTIADICTVFERGDEVFGSPIHWLWGGWWFRSKYRSAQRERQLRSLLRDRRLEQLQKKVLITTFDLDNEGTTDGRGAARLWKPKLFHNFSKANAVRGLDGVRQDPDLQVEAWRVAMYSTSAPTYFPTADGYIDGGVYANNPAMCALAQVFDHRYQLSPERNRVAADQVRLFSVGAGRNLFWIENKSLNWGAFRWWGWYYPDLTMDSTVGVADYQCSQMLGEARYRRLDADFVGKEKFHLDAVDRIRELREFAYTVPLDNHIEWLKQNWMPKPTRKAFTMEATSKHILGTSELTCLMPIKQGFVGEFETRTYATRLRIAMRVLHAMRLASREVSVRVFPDVVDVISSIHSFRLGIINERQLLLSVEFDRPWEPYMRLVWKGLGPLLDPLLINCVDYEECASDKGFDRFSSWVRRHQVDTGLFYTASTLTVNDARYLTQLEHLQRQTTDPLVFDKAAAVFVPADPVKEAAKQAAENPHIVERSALKVISALYGLRDSYPDRAMDGKALPDARYLVTAARQILKTFDPRKLPPAIQKQFEAELAWLIGPADQVKTPPVREAQTHEMQSGILPPPKKEDGKREHHTAHGALLLIRVIDAAKARTFLRDKLNRLVTSQESGSGKEVYTNVAFTFNGLKKLEVTDTELSHFPKEFREGMEARAGLLGDVLSNHPTNWSFPECNWPDGQKTSMAPVPMSTIDIVVKLRAARKIEPIEHEWTKRHPLYAFATEVFGGDPSDTGIQVMSVQPMFHYVEKGKVIDHFEFIDGISQPVPQADRDLSKENWDNEVSLGDLFLGYRNDRRDPPFFDENDPDVLPGRVVGSLLDNGTFLVVRKLYQDVATLEAFFEQNERDLGIQRSALAAKMLGREANGDPLATGWKPSAEQNDFDYDKDKGEGCPLHAHMRRANPRDGRVPRIMRRGMSYGPRYKKGAADAGADRGLIFLAYNASIAEQFETIQRWMTGGNSTGGFSGEADPFLRVPQPDACGVFRFVDKSGKVVRLNIDSAMVQQVVGSDKRPRKVVKPFVKLQWGMYLFVPSMSALKTIAADPKGDAVAEQETIAFGEKVIASLTTDDHWTAILEDVTANHSGTTAAVYAALRARGGVHRSSGGGMVLVATEKLVLEVLRRDDFSVSEYRNRMKKSIGEIYLGLDAGAEYAALADLNKFVSAIKQAEAFRIANDVTSKLLAALLAQGKGNVTVALDKLTDNVLAHLSTYWFGVPNGNEIKVGGRPAPGADTVHLPHHSLPPSRYIFSSPLPRPIVTFAGERSGDALRKAVTALAEENGVKAFDTQLSREVWYWIEEKYGRPDPELFGRMLVGLIEGFLPTVNGNFLKTAHLWLSEETLWRVQQDLLSWKSPANVVDYHQRAQATIEDELKRAMQRRPVPDVVYRTAVRQCNLGGTTIQQGERVAVLLGSATQQIAVEERAGVRPPPAHPRESAPNVMPIFGGNRLGPNPPTHACPAHEMGMGVLLGMFSALLEAGTLSPTGSSLSVTLSQAAVPGAGGVPGGGGAAAGQPKSVQPVASTNSCPWQ